MVTSSKLDIFIPSYKMGISTQPLEQYIYELQHRKPAANKIITNSLTELVWFMGNEPDRWQECDRRIRNVLKQFKKRADSDSVLLVDALLNGHLDTLIERCLKGIAEGHHKIDTTWVPRFRESLRQLSWGGANESMLPNKVQRPYIRRAEVMPYLQSNKSSFKPENYAAVMEYIEEHRDSLFNQNFIRDIVLNKRLPNGDFDPKFKYLWHYPTDFRIKPEDGEVKPSMRPGVHTTPLRMKPVPKVKGPAMRTGGGGGGAGASGGGGAWGGAFEDTLPNRYDRPYISYIEALSYIEKNKSQFTPEKYNEVLKYLEKNRTSLFDQMYVRDVVFNGRLPKGEADPTFDYFYTRPEPRKIKGPAMRWGGGPQDEPRPKYGKYDIIDGKVAIPVNAQQRALLESLGFTDSDFKDGCVLLPRMPIAVSYWKAIIESAQPKMGGGRPTGYTYRDALKYIQNNKHRFQPDDYYEALNFIQSKPSDELANENYIKDIVFNSRIKRGDKDREWIAFYSL